MTNVILYCRVSSDEQKDNNSLKVQEEYLMNHCNYHGYNVVNVYREDYSAKHYDMKRPELKAIYMSIARSTRERLTKYCSYVGIDTLGT